MTSFFNAPFADTNGVFSLLDKGGSNLDNNLLPKLSMFIGAIAVMAGAVFLVVAVVKTRDKVRWFWMSAGAFIVGAMLIMGAAHAIQTDSGNTWGEVFDSGGSGSSSGSSNGTTLLFDNAFHDSGLHD